MIFCVEDEVSIRDIEVYALNAAGMEARRIEDGNELWKALGKEQPELIIMDVMLPGTDGVELLRKIKNTPELCEIPVIMATAKGAEYDKIVSLELGADDYLVKPFGMLEMVSRVKAVLRRTSRQYRGERLRSAGVELDVEKHRVTVDGNEIVLSHKEYELLRMFLLYPGIAHTREQLFSRVWLMKYMEDSRTLDMHIYFLRTKLGGYGDRIETVRSVGYRWKEE